ncbi:MAG: hypothetical protein QOG80_3105 [Pseudonocardiales bacterium]|jgi:hypothetical protein|nr:hypothetical protein [Pseudonocardiales bacterium]
MATTTVAAPRVQTNERRVTNATAAIRDQRYRNLQLILFAAGGVLMPLGIVVIGLGWYGTAHAHYDYDQRTYLISGGILGLGLTIFGGFLYFGAWLAKIAADQRDSARQLADSLLVLGDMVSRQSGASAGLGAVAATSVESGAVPVFAGDGTTVHRRDCPLIAHRDDLHPLTGNEVDPTLCRVCRPIL